MRRLLLLSIFWSMASLSFGQTIIEKKSIVNFSVRGAKGTITGLKGEVKFDPKNLGNSSFDVTLDVNTLNTNIKKRDKHLMKKPYFAQESYPVLTFKSKSIEKQEDKYLTKGNLTIKGISLAVEIPFDVVKKGEELILTGEMSIDRKDYHIGKKVGKVLIGREVVATITCVLKK
ncbi:MAG: YceI family protein [Aureispira sp.]|nr:YceI family protein [Aureispira sp.]